MVFTLIRDVFYAFLLLLFAASLFGLPYLLVISGQLLLEAVQKFVF